jgi:hypothetical protein
MKDYCSYLYALQYENPAGVFKFKETFSVNLTFYILRYKIYERNICKSIVSIELCTTFVRKKS